MPKTAIEGVVAVRGYRHTDIPNKGLYGPKRRRSDESSAERAV